MQRSQAVGKPGYGVRLARTCAVLDQVILCRPVCRNILMQLVDGIALVVSGKYNAFLNGLFPGSFVCFLFCFNEDELAYQFQ